MIHTNDVVTIMKVAELGTLNGCIHCGIPEIRFESVSNARVIAVRVRLQCLIDSSKCARSRAQGTKEQQFGILLDAGRDKTRHCTVEK